MKTDFSAIEELKKNYPDEWVLLGNPTFQNTTVLGGVLLFHSKDKKEVCYIGRDKIANFQSVTITFAGDLRQNRKIGILRKL
jgi:hypothetical protein